MEKEKVMQVLKEALAKDNIYFNLHPAAMPTCIWDIYDVYTNIGTIRITKDLPLGISGQMKLFDRQTSGTFTYTLTAVEFGEIDKLMGL